MEIQDLKPRSGSDTLRLGDSDELVVMENFGSLPQSEIQIQLHKNDLYVYMAHSVVTNFMSSPDFNCRQIWLSRSELCNIDMYGKVSLADLPYLKQHPTVHLTDDDVTLLDEYFQLLCRRMRDQSPMLYSDIVRSLVSTMILEMLCIARRQEPENARTGNFYRQRLADKFMRLVEESDGRIRRVDDFANQLNITPKYLSTLLKETMSRRPMQEIANDLNFPNASFFGKYVKEHLGMTPLEYRNKYHR